MTNKKQSKSEKQLADQKRFKQGRKHRGKKYVA